MSERGFLLNYDTQGDEPICSAVWGCTGITLVKVDKANQLRYIICGDRITLREKGYVAEEGEHSAKEVSDRKK
jgi:hypothetical protein